jgi:hypothetical protein
MDDFISREKPISSTKLVDTLNEGIIKCIQSSGKILPSSFLPRNAPIDFQWTEYASVKSEVDGGMVYCSPCVEDLRQFVPVLLETMQEHNLIGSDGRPILYAACLGLLLSKRELGQATMSNVTPLSTFLEIAEFLDDELEVDFNEPTQTKGACHRPPLHLLARSCYPEAVSFLCGHGADKNDTDDEGWTALMACCLPDIPSEADGGPTYMERVQTIKVLMNDSCEREQLDINSQNFRGYTAMHYACEGLNAALIQCLLDGSDNVPNVDLTLKTIWGETMLGVVRSNREQDPEKAVKCEAILISHLKRIKNADPIHLYLEDERKAYDLMDLINDVLIPASRGKVDSDGDVTERVGSLAAQDRRIITALMNHIQLDPSLLFQHTSHEQCNNQITNIYEVMHRRILDLIPTALIQVYCNRNPTDEERGIVTCINYNLRKSSEVFQNGARRIDASAMMGKAFCLHRERGHVSSQIDLLTNLFVSPLQRIISFAIPSNDVIEHIVGIAPRILEVGAGTGYWSYLLSKFGADIIAYDARPPGQDNDTTTSNLGNNVYFGSSSSYYPVKYGIASTIFGVSRVDVKDRALLIVWPNNPDAVDNPHVAVATESLPDVWDLECVEKFYQMGGEIVVFVGERKDNIELLENASALDWGFCASRKFQQFLQDNFELTATLQCPQWWMKEDDVTVWKRL